MSSIGKFTAALAAISQEVTITAANFNLDFTLMKVEAPAEYQPLGSAISLHRQHQAESGSAHRTARKLGALFESIIPYTPTLYKAYGQRASTLIETQTAKGLNDKLVQSGPFSTHAGPDATTIWAAATSGKRAISVHLLACMLARIWKGPEAISVWVELVARRKAEIVQEFEQGSIQSTTDLLAEQQEISRSHLAIWDSSARAWLQTADEALCVKQTQLKLVLDNVNIPVENSSDLYTSVIKAWKTALLLVDRLASGSPQSVQDGSVLLGLSAWHMYPDMLVLGKSTVRIEQKDDLIAPGGILTIGLEYSNREGSGLFWSLPLAHMHFYGDTPTVTRSLTTTTSRVPVNALFQVALGNLSSQWMVDTTESSDMIAEMHRCLMTGLGISGASAMKSMQQHNWFAAIHQASIDSINSVGQTKELNEKLHALGARRSHTFLTNVAEKAEKYFDLNQFPKLLSLMKDCEAQIEFLRAIGRNLGLEPDDIFVRYRPEKSLKLDKPRPYASKPEWRYASVVPHSFTSLKRSSEGQQKIRQVYCRWFSLPPKPSGDTLASQQYEAHFSALLGAIAERLGESGKPMADIPSISPAQNQLNMIADEPAASMETFIPTTAYNFERYIDDYSFVWQGFGLDTCTGDHNETFRSLGAGI
ncbi:hypothetical protein B0J14DRAFT_543808 [Halenospora varia]|nr:hypothetical protein B0J14DRAFT_543808 [Halenospora varia]